jgi:hypothetical protein
MIQAPGHRKALFYFKGLKADSQKNFSLSLVGTNNKAFYFSKVSFPGWDRTQDLLVIFLYFISLYH